MIIIKGTDVTLRHTSWRHQKKENFYFLFFGLNLYHLKERQKRNITLKIAFRYDVWAEDCSGIFLQFQTK